jgi:hypothetical protein
MFVGPFDRVLLRDIFPFARTFFGDWYAPRYLQWLVIACAVSAVFALLAWLIDRILKSRGLK